MYIADCRSLLTSRKITIHRTGVKLEKLTNAIALISYKARMNIRLMNIRMNIQIEY